MIVCNELSSFDDNKKIDYERLKSLITENTIEIHKKRRDATQEENLTNFIFILINFAPIKIEEGDRRYVVIETSHVVPSKEYFENLHKTFTDDFYRNLLCMFLNVDISQWDKTNIPMTAAKETVIEKIQNNFL